MMRKYNKREPSEKFGEKKLLQALLDLLLTVCIHSPLWIKVNQKVSKSVKGIKKYQKVSRSIKKYQKVSFYSLIND